MDTHIVLQYIEIIIAICGIAYGIFEHNKRTKLANVLKTITQTYPGDVAKIEQSCKWAWSNVREASNQVLKVPEGPEKHNVIRHLTLASGDAAASHRMCIQLFNQLLAFQQAQFNTRTVIHPEKDTLDLCKAEAKNSK